MWAGAYRRTVEGLGPWNKHMLDKSGTLEKRHDPWTTQYELHLDSAEADSS